MSKKIRLGLVPYLNVKPLVYPLLDGSVRHNFKFTFAPPSQLAKSLKERKLDIALIPSIEYAASSEYLILPDFAIAAQGAVRSVFLYTKKPVSEVKTVALDTSSRTSAALVKILFAEHFKTQPQYINVQPSLDRMMEKADAALIIGDNALQITGEKYTRLDLAEEWLNLTGRPFVFAFFAAHHFSHLEECWQTLLRAKELGMQRISQIAYKESVKLGLSYFTCFDYLTQRINYDFSPEQLAGLNSFYRLAGANNLIGKDVRLKFYQQRINAAISAPSWKVVGA